MKRLRQDLLALFFPSTCLLCGGPKSITESFLCSPCLIRLPRERNYNGFDNDTASRLRGIFPFLKAYSFLRFSKKGPVQKLVHKAKYERQPKLAFQLGMWLAYELLMPIKNQFDVIIPVPLYPHKLKSRGYNQSTEIASGIASVTSSTLVEALVRRGNGETQTQLNRWSRFENTSNEFGAINPNILKDQRVLLVDDIVTTGATLAGAAAPLLENKVAGIIIAAIALTQES